MFPKMDFQSRIPRSLCREKIFPHLSHVSSTGGHLKNLYNKGIRRERPVQYPPSLPPPMVFRLMGNKRSMRRSSQNNKSKEEKRSPQAAQRKVCMCKKCEPYSGTRDARRSICVQPGPRTAKVRVVRKLMLPKRNVYNEKITILAKGFY